MEQRARRSGSGAEDDYRTAIADLGFRLEEPAGPGLT